MVFLALPLLVLASLVHARRPAPAVAVALAAGLAACLIVLAAPAPDARLVGRLVAHGVPLEDARGLVQLQLGQGAFEMLGVMAGMWRANPLNGAIALAHGAAGGVAILAVCLLTPGALRPVAERLPPAVPAGPRGLLAGLLVTGAALGPLAVLAFAWDLTRLAALSAFTAFLTADLLLRRGEPSVAPPDPARSSRLATLACGTLAVAFLCLPFVALWFGGLYQNDFDPVVRDPLRDLEPIRSAFERFFAFYNRDGP
jgi:hypothetical protein